MKACVKVDYIILSQLVGLSIMGHGKNINE
jgi:hypothetical protein